MESPLGFIRLLDLVQICPLIMFLKEAPAMGVSGVVKDSRGIVS